MNKMYVACHPLSCLLSVCQSHLPPSSLLTPPLGAFCLEHWAWVAAPGGVGEGSNEPCRQLGQMGQGQYRGARAGKKAGVPRKRVGGAGLEDVALVLSSGCALAFPKAALKILMPSTRTPPPTLTPPFLRFQFQWQALEFGGSCQGDSNGHLRSGTYT